FVHQQGIIHEEDELRSPQLSFSFSARLRAVEQLQSSTPRQWRRICLEGLAQQSVQDSGTNVPPSGASDPFDERKQFVDVFAGKRRCNQHWRTFEKKNSFMCFIDEPRDHSLSIPLRSDQIPFVQNENGGLALSLD